MKKNLIEISKIWNIYVMPPGKASVVSFFLSESIGVPSRPIVSVCVFFFSVDLIPEYAKEQILVIVPLFTSEIIITGKIFAKFFLVLLCVFFSLSQNKFPELHLLHHKIPK